MSSVKVKKWIDETTGLTCMIRRVPSGTLNGYVGVTENHPLYKRNPDDDDEYEIVVHGGVTFSAFWEEENDQLWYIGFDCAHGMIDIIPAYPDLNALSPQATYKDIDFVEQECRRLASQIKDLK